ncbi:MAG: D-2-hydroxyacid dehydrogenase [Candidatus Atribacteria bacterium]|nr:D-2-hydroxyacid dehydrogenase [Candidatus Atribacteria bacterium]MBE3127988.1 D-2-hydroxyacid dehydrogenase [Candidatus Atribacteria bacterium]
MSKILVTDGMDKGAIQALKNLGHEVTEQFFEPEELKEQLKGFNVVIVRSATKVRKGIIDSALETGNLKLIIRGGVGVDNIDVVYAESNGIKVRNTPKASSLSVAELALGHMFSLARFIGIANVTMREGRWIKNKYTGIELSGKTLGLIGFGKIGHELAKKAKALEMKVIYNDILGPAKDCPEYSFVSLDELLTDSDFISLHVPGDEDESPMIGKPEFTKMKDGAYLINCSRGSVVDEAALLEALNSGKLAGAGIDVFLEEPTKNMELVNHERVSVTPHIGASTKEAQKRIGQEIVSIIKDNL